MLPAKSYNYLIFTAVIYCLFSSCTFSAVLNSVNNDEYYEDDEFETFLELPSIDSKGRNALSNPMLRWPWGIIPYELSDNFTEVEKETIRLAISIFDKNTCIKLIPKQKKNVDWLRYEKGKGCGTNVGFWKGKTSPHKLVMNEGCLKLTAAIQHETMHVMGIFHEQCRYDRDEYIDVVWKNIPQKQQKNFITVPKIIADSYGIEYDYESLMHYKGNAFAKKGTNVTMIAKKEKDSNGKKIVLGYVGGPTARDFLKINRMYNCTDFL